MYTTPSSLTQTQIGTVRSFFNRTYSWMTAGLLLTAFIAWYTASNPGLQAFVLGVGLLPLILVQFGLVLFISFAINRINASTAGVLFIVYAAATGFLLSGIFLRYSSGTLATAFLSSALMFGAMSVYGYTTKADLSKLRTILFMGLIGLVIAMIINLFLNSGPFQYVISFIGVALFTVLTAYDTQRLKVMALTGMGDIRTDIGEKMAVFGALQLYLDLINMFLFLLQLFGGGGRR